MGANIILRDTTITSSFLLIFLITLTSSITTHAAVFNVKRSGAKGDGKTDDSKAIMSSWKRACESSTPSQLVIPRGRYLVSSLIIEGPCKSPTITMQLRGTLISPADVKAFKSHQSWVLFQRLEGFTLFGGGTFDGQGSLAWSKNTCAKTGTCNNLPNNLGFNGVKNSKIQDITSLNSKLFHMNIINCNNVTFQKVTVTAPEESLNTDGIHMGRSKGITISGANIKTGDDCISLGDGSEQIIIEDVKCGPGHGISIGSLGRYPNEQPVVGVTVRRCTFTNTMNGVRIKTWPASPAGVASDLHFESLTMNNVSTPVLIDQEYCPYNKCQRQVPSKVKISNVSFKDIKGTSFSPVAVKIVCSKGIPCQKVDISGIELKFQGKDGKKECSNVLPRPSICSAI